MQHACKFQIRTTIPMLFFVPSRHSSTVSSMTTFINGSKPRRIPATVRPPFSFSIIRLSMYLKIVKLALSFVSLDKIRVPPEDITSILRRHSYRSEYFHLKLRFLLWLSNEHLLFQLWWMGLRHIGWICIPGTFIEQELFVVLENADVQQNSTNSVLYFVWTIWQPRWEQCFWSESALSTFHYFELKETRE